MYELRHSTQSALGTQWKFSIILRLVFDKGQHVLNIQNETTTKAPADFHLFIGCIAKTKIAKRRETIILIFWRKRSNEWHFLWNEKLNSHWKPKLNWTREHWVRQLMIYCLADSSLVNDIRLCARSAKPIRICYAPTFSVVFFSCVQYFNRLILQ